MAILMTLAGGFSASCGGDGAADQEGRWQKLREDMVAAQIAARGVRDERVLQAMRTVPRHLFVPADVRMEAYDDHPLPIGEGQTISQPYIVGLMSELLEVAPGDRVLEIGTGSGYQAAVLAAMGCEVYSIEIREPLAAAARQLLESLHYGSVHVGRGTATAAGPRRRRSPASSSPPRPSASPSRCSSSSRWAATWSSRSARSTSSSRCSPAPPTATTSATSSRSASSP